MQETGKEGMGTADDGQFPASSIYSLAGTHLTIGQGLLDTLCSRMILGRIGSRLGICEELVNDDVAVTRHKTLSSIKISFVR